MPLFSNRWHLTLLSPWLPRCPVTHDWSPLKGKWLFNIATGYNCFPSCLWQLMEPKAPRLNLLLWVGIRGITVFSNFQCCEEKIDSMKWSEVQSIASVHFLHQPFWHASCFCYSDIWGKCVTCGVQHFIRIQKTASWPNVCLLVLVGETCWRTMQKQTNKINKKSPVNCLRSACLPLLQNSFFLFYQDNSDCWTHSGGQDWATVTMKHCTHKKKKHSHIIITIIIM